MLFSKYSIKNIPLCLKSVIQSTLNYSVSLTKYNGTNKAFKCIVNTIGFLNCMIENLPV